MKAWSFLVHHLTDVITLGSQIFYFSPCTCVVSDKISAFIFFPLYKGSFFSIIFFRIFPFTSVSRSLTVKYCGMDFFGLMLLGVYSPS